MVSYWTVEGLADVARRGRGGGEPERWRGGGGGGGGSFLSAPPVERGVGGLREEGLGSKRSALICF